MNDWAAGPVPDQPASAGGESPLAYRAVRGGLWVAASSYWNIGVGFVATVALTRLLATEAFGIFALATFFAQLLRLQPKLGLGYAFARHKETTGEALGTYFAMDLAAATAGVALALLAVPVLLVLGYSDVVVAVSVVLALAAAMEGVTGMGSLLLERELHFRPTSLIQSVVFPVSYVPALWLATHNGGVWSLVAQNITYNALFLGGVWIAVRRQLPHLWQLRWQFDRGLARRFLGFGATVGLGLLAGMLLTQLDNFFIGTLVGVTVLGFYDRAYRTAQWPATLLNSLLSRAAFYTYAKLQDDKVRLQKTVTMVLWIITTLALPLALVIFIAAPDLLVLLYGERWLPATLFLRILVVYSVARPLWENAGTLLVAMGKPRLSTTLIVIQVLVLAAAGLPLTMVWGAIGTCVAVGLAFAVGLVLIYRDVAREVAINVVEVLGKPALVCAITVAGYVVLNRLLVLNYLPLVAGVGVKALYALVVFSGLTMLFSPRSALERIGYVRRLAMQSRGQ